jgi:hypothetical protein
MGGAAGGTGPAPECTVDKDCGANAKCVDGGCKKDDGQTCTAPADCQNACIDGMCTSKLDDGKPCKADMDCAHTCIDGMCSMPSDLGGDCDVEGAGGAGGAGAGGAAAVVSAGGNAGAGGAGEAPQNPDCKSPLECVMGKCLTPDGQPCTDNPDCINTCINNKCAPKSPLDGPCGDLADCDDLGGMIKVVCDMNKHACKLDVTSLCQTNAQCQSNRCICAKADCSVRACKTADSTCECKWSQADAPSCDNSSPDLNKQTQDPNGCTGANFCSNGNCIPNDGGTCTTQCVFHPSQMNGMTTTPAYCSSNGPTACKNGYTGTPNGDCTLAKDGGSCSAGCTCVLN